MSAADIVNKVWNYAHVLRDDGVGYAGRYAATRL
jgi:type I restriction enzyme M protein